MAIAEATAAYRRVAVDGPVVVAGADVESGVVVDTGGVARSFRGAADEPMVMRILRFFPDMQPCFV